MALISSILRRRRQAKAETKAKIKAAEARAKAEVAASAKERMRREKLLNKYERDLLKVEKKGAKARQKHELKLVEAQYDRIRNGGFSAATVLKWVSAMRVLAPVVLPLVQQAVAAVNSQLAEQNKQRAHSALGNNALGSNALGSNALGKNVLGTDA